MERELHNELAMLPPKLVYKLLKGIKEKENETKSFVPEKNSMFSSVEICRVDTGYEHLYSLEIEILHAMNLPQSFTQVKVAHKMNEWKEAALSGDSYAALRMGWLYIAVLNRDSKLEESYPPKMAAPWAELAVTIFQKRKPEAKELYLTGLILFYAGGCQDLEGEAMDYIKKAAEAGENDALLALEIIYYDRTIISFEKAKNLLIEAHLKKSNLALNRIFSHGLDCLYGLLGNENKTLAIKWFKVADKFGHLVAKSYLKSIKNGTCSLGMQGNTPNPRNAKTETHADTQSVGADSEEASSSQTSPENLDDYFTEDDGIDGDKAVTDSNENMSCKSFDYEEEADIMEYTSVFNLMPPFVDFYNTIVPVDDLGVCDNLHEKTGKLSDIFSHEILAKRQDFFKSLMSDRPDPVSAKQNALLFIRRVLEDSSITALNYKEKIGKMDFRLFREKFQDGDATGLFYFAQLAGRRRKFHEKMRWLTMACALRYIPAFKELLLCFFREMKGKMHSDDLRALRADMSSGHTEATGRALGILCALKGTKLLNATEQCEREKALKWYELGIEMGDWLSAYNLISARLKRCYGLYDEAQARKYVPVLKALCKKQAREGSFFAQLAMGASYNPDLAGKDSDEVDESIWNQIAFLNCNKMAKQGNLGAIVQLAIFFATGDTVPLDSEKAELLYEMAIDSGSRAVVRYYAQFCIKMIYGLINNKSSDNKKTTEDIYDWAATAADLGLPFPFKIKKMKQLFY